VRIASALDHPIAPTNPDAELGQVVTVAERVNEETTRRVLGDTDVERSLAVRVSRPQP